MACALSLAGVTIISIVTEDIADQKAIDWARAFTLFNRTRVYLAFRASVTANSATQRQLPLNLAVVSEGWGYRIWEARSPRVAVVPKFGLQRHMD